VRRYTEGNLPASSSDQFTTSANMREEGMNRIDMRCPSVRGVVVALLLSPVAGCRSTGTSSDFTLTDLIHEIGSSKTTVQRPASSLSIIGYEQDGDQLVNQILKQGPTYVTSGDSWASRTLTYSSDTSFTLDFKYYVDAGTSISREKNGNAILKRVAVDRITNAVPDLGSGRLREVFADRDEATATFSVVKEQIRAAAIAFDGSSNSAISLSAKPAAALPDGVTAAVQADHSGPARRAAGSGR
jgi:hypothetical protein